MFFRSKKNTHKSTDAQPDAPAATVAARVPSVSAIPSKPSETKPAATPAKGGPAASPLAPEELKQRAEASKRFAASMGDLVGLMARSPNHRDHKLADVQWLVAPAVRSGQFAMATAQSKSDGIAAPVAAVLWANVSTEVDKRIAENLSAPIRLAAKEWKSGDIVWVVDAIGDRRVVSELVKRLKTTEWKGKAVKARVVDAQKKVTVGLIETQSAVAGSANLAN